MNQLRLKLEDHILKSKEKRRIIRFEKRRRKEQKRIDLERQKQELEHLKVQLEILNPRNVLSRGYSISLDEKGKPISAKTIKNNEKIRTILQDGEVISTVNEIKETNHE